MLDARFQILRDMQQGPEIDGRTTWSGSVVMVMVNGARREPVKSPGGGNRRRRSDARFASRTACGRRLGSGAVGGGGWEVEVMRWLVWKHGGMARAGFWTRVLAKLGSNVLQAMGTSSYTPATGEQEAL